MWPAARVGTSTAMVATSGRDDQLSRDDVLPSWLASLSAAGI